MDEQTAVEQAHALIQVSRYQEAADAARTGLAAKPDDAVLHRLLAIASCENGDHMGAVEVAQRAVALEPENAVGHRILGWSLHKAGRPDEAKAALKHALALNPDDALAHVMLGDVMLKNLPSRMPRRALRGSKVAQEIDFHGAEAIRLDPDGAAGYIIRGKASLMEEDPFRASSWASEALKRQPDHSAAHQLLGMTAQLTGDTSAAADHYVTAGRLNPRSEGSMKLLRGLRSKAPFGAILAFIIIRLIALPFKDASGAIQAVGLGLIAAFLIFIYVVWPRLHARRQMSDEARQLLTRERQLRRR